MTFGERYQQSGIWYEKVIVMEIYHLAQMQRNKRWKLSDTAQSFAVSVGLVSENLQLADMMHYEPKLIDCKTREEALIKMRNNNRQFREA